MPKATYNAKKIRGKIYFTLFQTYPGSTGVSDIRRRISLEKIREGRGATFSYAPEGLHTFVVNPESPEEYFDIENNSIKDTIDGIPTVQYALNKITQDMIITIHKESHISNIENANEYHEKAQNAFMKQFISLVIDTVQDQNKKNKYFAAMEKIQEDFNSGNEILIRLNCHREIADFLIEPNKDENGNITSLRSRVLEDEEVVHLLDNAVHLCEVLNKLVAEAKENEDEDSPSLINHWRNELGKMKRFIFDRTNSSAELVALKEKHAASLRFHDAILGNDNRAKSYRRYYFYPKEGRAERKQEIIDKYTTRFNNAVNYSLTTDELDLINHIDPTIKIEGANTGMVQWWKEQYDNWENGTVAPFQQPDYSANEMPEILAYDNYRYQYLTPEQVEELIADEEAAEASITLSGG